MEELFQIVSLSVASIFTSALSATIGMAGGIVLLSFMTFFLPLNIIVPIHGVVQLVSNSYRTYLLRKNIRWPIFYYFCIGLPFGALTSIYLIKKIDNPKYALILIALLIFYVVFKPKKLPSLKIPYWSFSFIGFLVGFLGPLIGATGPAIAMFFLRDDLNKEEVVATKSSVQIAGHIIKIPTFLYLGFNYQDYTLLLIAMILMTFVGTRIGVKLLSLIRENHFRIVFKSALLIAAVRVLYKALTI